MDERLLRVVETTDRNRQAFERFCRSLSPGELERPIPESHWLVRDYVAHLASIDIWMYEWFDALAAGRRFVPRGDDGGPFNIDTWNDARVQERRGRPLDELLAEAANTRARLYETFPRFTNETLTSDFDFRERRVSFIEYLELWTLHDPAHAFDMLRALPEQRQVPWVREWIDQFRAESMRLVADARRQG